MGFLHPLALLALPLSLLPLWLEWRGLRTGRPIRFSSLYLLERARRTHVPRLPTRSRWVALLRAAAIALLVIAAARPLGCGSGDPASHRPTRAIVAVDVSASAGQVADGVTAWSRIRAAADSILAAASPEDRVALAAVADGIVGWWESPAPALRARLGELEPGDRPSDWPRALAALDSRISEDTEAYLLTDGSTGAVPPAPVEDARLPGHRVVIVRGSPATGNRGLVSADWVGAGEVSLAGSAWGDAPARRRDRAGHGRRGRGRPAAGAGRRGREHHLGGRRLRDVRLPRGRRPPRRRPSLCRARRRHRSVRCRTMDARRRAAGIRAALLGGGDRGASRGGGGGSRRLPRGARRAGAGARPPPDPLLFARRGGAPRGHCGRGHAAPVQPRLRDARVRAGAGLAPARVDRRRPASVWKSARRPPP